MCWKKKGASDIREGHVHMPSQNKASQNVHMEGRWGWSRDDPKCQLKICIGASLPPITLVDSIPCTLLHRHSQQDEHTLRSLLPLSGTPFPHTL